MYLSVEELGALRILKVDDRSRRPSDLRNLDFFRLAREAGKAKKLSERCGVDVCPYLVMSTIEEESA